MSMFISNNFERQGNTENDLPLKGAEEICSEINSLSSSALKSIKIFSPDLEHALYNNENLRQTLLSFARGNRYAQIQILAHDTSEAMRQGHQLIRLSQQITSAMQLRITPEEYQNDDLSFLLIDQSVFIFNADSNKHRAFKSNCKNRAEILLDFFNRVWEQAEQDSKTRRLSL